MTSYWGASQIASRLGVTTEAVRKWIDRFADTSAPFPAPDVEINEADGRITRGWSPDRWDEIATWSETDRNRARSASQRAKGGRSTDSVPKSQLTTRSSGRPWESLVQNAYDTEVERWYTRNPE